MHVLSFILTIILATASAGNSYHQSTCTVTKTFTINTAPVIYITQTTTVTQTQGPFTTTIYADPSTIIIEKPQYVVTTSSVQTVKIKTKQALVVSTVTTTNTALTASYIYTLNISTASVISTILLETSDSTKNFKLWSGIQLTLILVGSLVFFI